MRRTDARGLRPLVARPHRRWRGWFGIPPLPMIRTSRLVKLLGILLTIAILLIGLQRNNRLPTLTRSRLGHAHDQNSDEVASRCVPRAGDGVDSIDPCWRPHVPLPAPAPPFPHPSVFDHLPPKVFEHWMEHGEIRSVGPSPLPTPKLDVVWTWVNGSDPDWREAFSRSSREEGIFSPGFHFREQNELQYSVRSVIGALGGEIGIAHILVADMPWNETKRANLVPETWSRLQQGSPTRVAQTPRWLDFGSIGCHVDCGMTPYRPRLRLVAHSDVFHLPKGVTETGASIEDERNWRNKALPCFNSKNIESRIGWIPGLGEVFVSLNDDFFLLRPHTATDFYSHFYGTVIRMDEGFYQQVRPIRDRRNVNDAGETSGLWHANYLLSRRFPKRLRPYLPHVPKVVTKSLHHEAVLMFKDELYISSQRRFRESKSGHGDIQLQWLSIALRIERWREALLWIFIVARLGDPLSLGLLGHAARSGLKHVLGVHVGREPVNTVKVSRGSRETLSDMRNVWTQAGMRGPLATKILFSSMDGHLPPISRPGSSPNVNEECTFDLPRCLGDFWTGDVPVKPEILFRRLAFEHPDCGDCLIMALVKSSGSRGLSAFLPEPDSVYRIQTETDDQGDYDSGHFPPILPLTPTWQETDFALDSVMRRQATQTGEIKLRQWSLQLLSRYLYVTGQSPAQFHMIIDAASAVQALAAVDQDPSVSMLGLNDNVLDESSETSDILTDWFQRRWPNRGWWERQ